MKTLSYGDAVKIEGLRRPYQLVLDQKGYRASRGLPFTDKTAKEELRRGGRSVGFIAIFGAHKAVNHMVTLGEVVQVSGVVYTVTAPGVGDGENASLIPATSWNQKAPTMNTHKALG